MMQDTVLRVLVLTLGLLMCPRDDPVVEEEWGDAVTAGMQKQEDRMLREEVKLDQDMIPVSEKMTDSNHRWPQSNANNISKKRNLSEKHVTDQHRASVDDDVHIQLSMNETSEKTDTDWEDYYLWYIWNTCSIISIMRFMWRYWRKKHPVTQKDTSTFPVPRIASKVPLPDSDTLQSFYSNCIPASPNQKWRREEFLEGFANQMVEAMKTTFDRNRGMVIEDCQMLDSCKIIVPFIPQEPYRFQFLLWDTQMSDLVPNMHVCGQIKLVENKIQNGCHCQSLKADDMVCLLHRESEKGKTKMTDVCDGPLCVKSTPFLSKSQVTRWFQSTIKEAWEQISHKYDFELSVRYTDAPCALAVRFRSGKKVCFRLSPVVKFNSDTHFYITPCSPNPLDTCWTLSLTIYEDKLLDRLSEHLPPNSCHIQTLKIACFLLRGQSALSGSSALKDFHFKTALLHLLLTKDQSQWKPNYVADRLRDLLNFMERSLEKKILHHILIGNPVTEKMIPLPAVFTEAKPVNLFHPLVLHHCIYRNVVMHFQEMLRNAHMLIQDYVNQ